MKILIVRSGPMEQFLKCIDQLNAKYENFDLSVLTQMKSTAEVIERTSASVYNYEGRIIYPWNISKELLTKLKAQQFHRVVVLYTNPQGRGFFWVKILAFLLGGKKTEAFTNQGDFIKLNISDFLDEIIYEKIRFIGYFFVWGFVFIKNQIAKGNNHADRN